jgi:hypothetical protein
MKFHFRRGGHVRPLTRVLQILSLLFSVIVLAVSCTKAASSSVVLSAEQISPQPPQAGPITVNFKLEDASKPVIGARITLEGDMTHAGMAPVFGDAKEVAPGEYQGQLSLNMGGDWVVLTHITLANGKKVEKQIDVNGVQSK